MSSACTERGVVCGKRTFTAHTIITQQRRACHELRSSPDVHLRTAHYLKGRKRIPRQRTTPSRDPAPPSLGASILALDHHGTKHSPRQGYVEVQTGRHGYAKWWTAIINHVGEYLSVRTVSNHGRSSKAQWKIGLVNSSPVRYHRLRRSALENDCEKMTGSNPMIAPVIWNVAG